MIKLHHLCGIRIYLTLNYTHNQVMEAIKVMEVKNESHRKSRSCGEKTDKSKSRSQSCKCQKEKPCKTKRDTYVSLYAVRFTVSLTNGSLWQSLSSCLSCSGNTGTQYQVRKNLNYRVHPFIITMVQKIIWYRVS